MSVHLLDGIAAAAATTTTITTCCCCCCATPWLSLVEGRGAASAAAPRSRPLLPAKMRGGGRGSRLLLLVLTLRLGVVCLLLLL